MSIIQHHWNKQYRKARGKAEGMLASATSGVATRASSRISATESIATAPGAALGSLNDPGNSIIQNATDDLHSIGIESGSFDIPEKDFSNTLSADPDPPHPTAGSLSAAGHTYIPIAGHVQVDTPDAVSHNARNKTKNTDRRDVIAKSKSVIEEWNRFYEAMLSRDVDEDLLARGEAVRNAHGPRTPARHWPSQR